MDSLVKGYEGFICEEIKNHPFSPLPVAQIHELRKIFDSIISMAEKVEACNLVGTREVMHEVFDLALETKLLKQELSSLRQYIKVLEDSKPEAKVVVEGVVREGTLLIPEEPTEEILKKMSDTNGPGDSAQMEVMYRRVIKAIS